MGTKLTIDKAIKNLQICRKDAGMVPDDEWRPTLNMAIRALKQEKTKQYGEAAKNMSGE
jgi:hypothetical protein